MDRTAIIVWTLSFKVIFFPSLFGAGATVQDTTTTTAKKKVIKNPSENVCCFVFFSKAKMQEQKADRG